MKLTFKEYMKLTNQEKQTISNIISRMIEDESIDKHDLLSFEKALSQSKQTVADYLQEGQS